MLCPDVDLGFAEHPVHGSSAQAPEIKQVVALCRERRVAIDVGAHIGIWSLELSRHFQEVHAFEPVQDNFSCLEQNTHGRPVVCHKVALGDSDGFCVMELPAKGNSGMWGVAEGQVPGRIVPLNQIDRYGFVDVGLIKIDVEGFEGNVVSGARDTITHSLPVIVFEDNGLGPRRYGADWINPKEVLADLGYKKFRRVNKDEIWVPSP